MSQNFIAVDRDQELLLPPSLREWLPDGHFAWFVLDAVEQMDLSGFYAAYRQDGHGRAAHDPAMMVALLLYGYARGLRSSKARPIPKSRPERLQECKRRLEEDLAVERGAVKRQAEFWAAGVASDGKRLGRRPNPYTPPDTPAGRKINTSDPDSRRLKAPQGYLQGYNAQTAVTDKQIVIAAEVNTETADFGHLEPMVDATLGEIEAVGVSDRPGVVVADAGYWHAEQMDSIVGRGIQLIVPPDAAGRKTPRPGWAGGRYAFMRRVLATDAGGELYRKRQGMIEPVFADTKFNRRIDRFLRRGRAAARSEWRLVTATHNLMKLHRHQLAPTTA